MRAWALTGLLVASLAAAGVGRSAPETGGGVLYLVRPDLRLCPSPMCGGFWLQRVNHASTRCLDGSRRRLCYVASVSGVSAPADTGLVRGRMAPAGIEGFPGHATLLATAGWSPAGSGPARGTVFRVVDNGVRCVTFPCFSLTASAVERTRHVTLSDVDLDRAGASVAAERRARRALASGGVYVAGTARVVPDEGPAGNGRTLGATQFWLPS